METCHNTPMLPCTGCKGLCCGPVLVTRHELQRIRRRIQSMPRKSRSALEGQERYPGTCIFYDLDADRCGIYPVRPFICRAFGHYSNLVCFKKPAAAAAAPWNTAENHVGLLSVDFTWKDFR